MVSMSILDLWFKYIQGTIDNFQHFVAILKEIQSPPVSKQLVQVAQNPAYSPASPEIIPVTSLVQRANNGPLNRESPSLLLINNQVTQQQDKSLFRVMGVFIRIVPG